MRGGVEQAGQGDGEDRQGSRRRVRWDKSGRRAKEGSLNGDVKIHEGRMNWDVQGIFKM